MPGYVYLVQVPEAKGTNRYKFGSSKKDDNSRINSYKKGVHVVLKHPCDDPIGVEKKVLELLSKKHKLYTGKEHFEGDIKEMVRDIETITGPCEVTYPNGIPVISTEFLIQSLGFQKRYQDPYDRYYPIEFIRCIGQLRADIAGDAAHELVKNMTVNGKRDKIPKHEFYRCFYDFTYGIHKREWMSIADMKIIEEFNILKSYISERKFEFDLGRINIYNMIMFYDLAEKYQQKMRSKEKRI